jgi:hypothetical protein
VRRSWSSAVSLSGGRPAPRAPIYGPGPRLPALSPDGWHPHQPAPSRVGPPATVCARRAGRARRPNRQARPQPHCRLSRMETRAIRALFEGRAHRARARCPRPRRALFIIYIRLNYYGVIKKEKKKEAPATRRGEGGLFLLPRQPTTDAAEVGQCVSRVSSIVVFDSTQWRVRYQCARRGPVGLIRVIFNALDRPGRLIRGRTFN